MEREKDDFGRGWICDEWEVVWGGAGGDRGESLAQRKRIHELTQRRKEEKKKIPRRRRERRGAQRGERGREETAAGLRPGLQRFASEERGYCARGLAFAVEESYQRWECGAEFSHVEEMVGIARAFGVRELELCEGFVEEMTAGT